MATYKGNDIAPPDQLDSDIKLTLAPRPGLENIEEDLNLPPSAELDHMRKPGEKNYMENQQMAKNPSVVPVVGRTGGGMDPDWEKFQEEQDRLGARKVKPKDIDMMPTPGAGPPGQGYRPYGSEKGDKFRQGGMVTKHGSSTHVACANKHR